MPTKDDNFKVSVNYANYEYSRTAIAISYFYSQLLLFLVQILNAG